MACSVVKSIFLKEIQILIKNEMFFVEIKDCTEGLRIHEKLQKQRRNLYQRT